MYKTAIYKVYFVRNYSTTMNSATRNEKPITINMSCFTMEKQENITATIQHYLHRSESPEFQTLRVVSYARCKVVIEDLRKEEERFVITGISFVECYLLYSPLWSSLRRISH